MHGVCSMWVSLKICRQDYQGAGLCYVVKFGGWRKGWRRRNGQNKKKKRNRDGRMGELVIAVWRNRAEPRNGFRSTMEQGSLGLVFLPFLVQLGNWHRDTSITVTAWFHFKKKKNPQPQTDGGLTNVVSITGHPPRLIGYGVYASWANLLGIQTTLNKWSIAVSIGPVQRLVCVLRAWWITIFYPSSSESD